MSDETLIIGLGACGTTKPVALRIRACHTHFPETLQPGVDPEALVGQVGNLRPIGNRPVSVGRTASSSRVSVAEDAPGGIRLPLV